MVMVWREVGHSLVLFGACTAEVGGTLVVSNRQTVELLMVVWVPGVV